MTFPSASRKAMGEKGDEFQYSDLIAERFGTNHHKIFVPSSKLIGVAAGDVRGDVGADGVLRQCRLLPLSKEVSKHIKVVQSGQGADEVFGGYHWYPPLASSNDVVDDYARVFFDRSHAKMAEHVTRNG